MNEVTRILRKIEEGNPQAAAQLLPLVYDELRRLAAGHMSNEAPANTLNATALVHEAYLRLVGDDPAKPWDGRGHFFAAASQAMRRILVDRARRKKAEKHGGGLNRVQLGDVAGREPDSGLVALDEALTELQQHDEEAAKLVTLRYFGGARPPGGRRGDGDLATSRRPALGPGPSVAVSEARRDLVGRALSSGNHAVARIKPGSPCSRRSFLAW